LVVGEFRGAEIADLLVALNTGHEGGAATVHANSAADVPARCVALGALGGLSADTVTGLLVSAIDLVGHLRPLRGGRGVRELALVTGAGGRVETVPVWTAGSGPMPGAPLLAARLDARGVRVPDLLQ
jgi:pilus assembly protein CpaF